MKQEDLFKLGAESLGKEIEIAQNIIINKINGINLSNMLNEEYEKNYSTTSECIKKWFEYGYDFTDLDDDNLFSRLLLNSKEYMNLCLTENQLDNSNPSLDNIPDYIISINQKVRFNIEYYISSELLNTLYWYLKTQNYDIYNPNYIAQTIFKLCGNITAFRNHFSSNNFNVKISNADLEIPDNAMYILTTLKMSLTHHIFFCSLSSVKQNKDDVITLLTIALLSIINISKIYKIENLIIETIYEIMNSSNPFIRLEKYMSNSSHNDNDILETSLNNAIELSKEYFSKGEISK